MSYDPRSYERNLSKYVKKPEKVRTSSGFELVTSRYPVRRSNQLSYDVIDVGSWSFVGSNEPVRNECEVIYEVFHIFKNCVWKVTETKLKVGAILE